MEGHKTQSAHIKRQSLLHTLIKEAGACARHEQQIRQIRENISNPQPNIVPDPDASHTLALLQRKADECRRSALRVFVSLTEKPTEQELGHLVALLLEIEFER